MQDGEDLAVQQERRGVPHSDRAPAGAQSQSGFARCRLLGVGIVLLPDFIVGEDIRQGRLVRLLPDWDISTIQLQVVYPGNRHIAVKVRRFVSFLAGKLRPWKHGKVRF